MKNRFLKVFLISLSIIILFIVGVILYIFSNKEAIKSYAINQINTYLVAKVDVASIDLTLFAQFPYVSLDLHQVQVAEPNNDKGTLLHAEHIYLSFNIYDIIQKKYQIKQISIDSGIVNLTIDKNGHPNYLIVKSNADTSTTLLYLKTVNLKQLHFTYLDEQLKQDYNGNVHQAELSFIRDKNTDQLICKSELYIQHIKTNGIQLIYQKELKSQFTLNIDEHKSELSIQHATLQIDQLLLTTSGNINYSNNVQLNLHASASESTIPALLSLLPFHLPEQFNQYKSEGLIKLEANINGEVSDKKTPTINIDFTVHKGKLIEPNTKTTLNDIECIGNFSNGFAHRLTTSEINISQFEFKLEQGNLSGSLQIKNFEHPFLKLMLKSQLPVSSILKFQQIDGISEAKGTIESDLKLNGLLSDYTSKNIANINASGFIKVGATDILLTKKDRKINSFDLLMNINGSSIDLDKLNIETDKTDISISGKINQVFPYLFNHEELNAYLKYKSKSLDVANIFFFSSNDNNSKDTIGFSLPERINLNIDFEIGALSYNLFNAKEIHGELNWQHNKLNLKAFKGNTMEGQLTMNATLDKGENNQYLISANAQLSSLNLKTLFKECADFGQQEITSNHIDGTLTGKIELVSVWDKFLNCETDKLFVNSDVQVTNGEINNYKPLESLSKYAAIDELRSLKFASLQNRIQIRNRTIYIPEMDAANNALNITLSGSHNFDNMVDYRFKIKLKELLTGKRKNKQNTNEYGEEDESGKGLYLYLSMKGPISNPTISYDKIGVKNKITQDLKSEKENIKELFKKELGIQKDTLIKEKQNNNDELEFEKN